MKHDRFSLWCLAIIVLGHFFLGWWWFKQKLNRNNCLSIFLVVFEDGTLEFLPFIAELLLMHQRVQIHLYPTKVKTVIIVKSDTQKMCMYILDTGLWPETTDTKFDYIFFLTDWQQDKTATCRFEIHFGQILECFVSWWKTIGSAHKWCCVCVRDRQIDGQKDRQTGRVHYKHTERGHDLCRHLSETLVFC